jgi:hypothetical protein
MRKLAYIFFIALFLFGCGIGSGVLNISYDPLDYPPQFFSPKDKRPALYIDSVVDNREIMVESTSIGLNSYREGKFEKDPTLIYSISGPVIGYPGETQKTSKTPSEIVSEALEMEVHRFGIKTTKDRGLADGVLNASIERFRIYKGWIGVEKLVEINLKLYQTGFDNPIWSGALKGKPSILTMSNAMRKDLATQGLNTALNMAIKRWHSYPGFKEH